MFPETAVVQLLLVVLSIFTMTIAITYGLTIGTLRILDTTCLLASNRKPAVEQTVTVAAALALARAAQCAWHETRSGDVYTFMPLLPIARILAEILTRTTIRMTLRTHTMEGSRCLTLVLCYRTPRESVVPSDIHQAQVHCGIPPVVLRPHPHAKLCWAVGDTLLAESLVLQETQAETLEENSTQAPLEARGQSHNPPQRRPPLRQYGRK